jgi:hypothetical protein
MSQAIHIVRYFHISNDQANNKRLIIFIDNLNKMEDIKGSSIKEYLRFSLANDGFWKSNVFRRTSNISWLASLDLTSSSFLEKPELSPRIMRHFNVFYLPENDYIDTELKLEYKEQIASVSDKIMITALSSVFDATIKLYRRLSTRMSSSSKMLGLFSLFDIKKSLQRLIIAVNQESMKSELVPQMWFHECSNAFKIRLHENEAIIFNDLLISTYTKYFQEEIPTGPRIFTDLNISNPDEERQLYRSLSDTEAESLAEMLKEQFPQAMSYPSSLAHICKLDANLGNLTSLTILDTSLGFKISTDLVEAASVLRSFEFVQFNLGMYEKSSTTWSNVFKTLLRKLIFSSSTAVLLITLESGCDFKEMMGMLIII